MYGDSEEDLMNYLSSSDDTPDHVPYFNSTLIDRTGAQNIKDIADVYDMSTIHGNLDLLNKEIVRVKCMASFVNSCFSNIIGKQVLIH